MSLDLNTLRAAVTVLSFLAFVGIVVWAWSRRNQSACDEAAQLPFLGDRATTPGSPVSLER